MGKRIAVVGAGIAGLAAAMRLRDRLPTCTIIGYESTRAPGGKLRTGVLAGGPFEAGAEMFLARDPAGGPSAAVALAQRVGLGAALVHPEPVPPAIAVDGALLPVPRGTLLGVPAELSMLDGVAHPAAELDRDEGRPLLRGNEDVAVGALVRRRLGDEVVDRLVDPLLGGVYAGRADGLSLAATMPGLAEACRVESTLVGAVRRAMAASAAHDAQQPVFATLHGGVSRLVAALLGAAGAQWRLGEPVTALARTATGWRVAGQEVDAVVLAVPGPAAARLLADPVPAAAEPIGALGYASVGLVGLALPHADLPVLSGFLVPAGQYTIKAVTFFGRKWRHHRRADGVALVRASVGRYGEVEALRRSDADLVALVRAELAALLGVDLPAPVAATVTRWGGALPQYAPGHLDRVAQARAAVPATLALAGAAYDGVGIPACIRSGEAAADAIIDALAG